MEDLLRRMTRQSRDLQERRQEIRGIWDDDAAQEINRRYLNPHEDDNNEILESFTQQQTALDEMQEDLRKADEQALLAEEQARGVDEALTMVQQETDNAHARHSQHLEHHATARDIIPTIYSLIEKANTSCS